MTAGGIALVVFWTLYLLANDRIGLVEPQYIPFEGSFVFADLLLTVMLFISVRALRHRTTEAPLYVAMAASMTLYLGILDGTFYARSGLLFSVTINGIVELSIVTACMVGGSYAMREAWVMWQDLLTSGAVEES